MARFLHTADLHLGKVIYNERLLDDQAAMLKEILQIIDAQKPDALLIAGDVFDRSVPPSDAVELLDDFLHAVCKERNTAVVMIPGNHDSADRVGFGARLLGDRLHIVSSLDRCTTPLTLHDTHGPIDVYGLPFLEPARVRAWTQDEDIRDHHTATAAMTARILQQNGASRKVLLAHAFVTGGLTSDSERALTIGGLDTVESSVFDGFSYVALGHLHRPQHVGRAAVQYSGSPLKYSASEVGYQKSITQIDLDAEGQCDIVRHPLHPVRDLVILEGLFDDIVGDASEAAETRSTTR
jgi:exonuclease SbcD